MRSGDAWTPYGCIRMEWSGVAVKINRKAEDQSQSQYLLYGFRSLQSSSAISHQPSAISHQPSAISQLIPISHPGSFPPLHNSG